MRDLGIDLVLPITDETIIPLCKIRHSPTLEARLGIAPQEALDITLDKSRTVALAQTLGIPVPKTRLIDAVDQLYEDGFIEQLSYPVVVKPQSSRLFTATDSTPAAIESLEVSYAATRDELEALVTEAEGRYRCLVQQYCAGEGVGVELVARQGEVVVAFQHRRLAEVPLTGGASAWRVGEPLDPVLYRYASSLAAALSWNGPMMVEFKVGQSPVLMEINGRVWGSLPLSYISGVDMPGAWAEVCLHEESPPRDIGSYRTGQSAYNPDLLLSWMGQNLAQSRKIDGLPYPGRGRFLPVLFGALLRGRHDYFVLDDLGPFLHHSSTVVVKYIGKLARQVASAGSRA
ncbi:MAG: ATP-grasp domain-containing protein [Pseudomonadota bacterium]